MELLVNRRWKKDTYTIGELFINGKKFSETCEDKDRGLKDSMPLSEIKAKKIYSKTAIPTGVYSVQITYSPRFKKAMPILCNVRGFSGIRIHSGNTAEDTEGCILCGMNTEVGKVTNSRFWTEKVYEYIRQGIKGGVIISIHR